VDDVAVGLKHVHLLNGLDGLNIELVQRSLELLAVSGSGELTFGQLVPSAAVAVGSELAFRQLNGSEVGCDQSFALRNQWNPTNPVKTVVSSHLGAPRLQHLQNSQTHQKLAWQVWPDDL